MQNDFFRAVGVIAVGLIIVIGGFAAIHVVSISPLWGESGAAWVQAIGATVGIGLAVWLPYKQRLDDATSAAEDHREAQKRICMAFLDELTILRANFDGANVQEILREAPGEVFNTEIPIPRERFPIFNSMIGRLVTVDDAGLRRGIIQAYEAANGVIDVAALNNRRLHDHQDLLYKANLVEHPMHDGMAASQHEQLCKLRTSLRTLVTLTIDRVDLVIPKLERVIAES